MEKVFISSPYSDNPKKNIEDAIEYCRMADDYCKIPIAPHVYVTRVFPQEDLYTQYLIIMSWGMDLMKECKEIWIFCDELTEGMIEEIEHARDLGLEMRFFTTDRREITNGNFDTHTEIGPAYGRLVTNYFTDYRHSERGCADCSSCRRDGGKDSEAGKGTEQPEGKVQHSEEGSSRIGFFDRIFGRK